MTANRYAAEDFEAVFNKLANGKFCPGGHDYEVLRYSLRIAKAISAIPREDLEDALHEMESSAYMEHRSSETIISLLTASLETE